MLVPKLLIVDDNAPIRYLMRFYLERAGYVVCGQAKGGVEGIEEAKRTQPDVIVLQSNGRDQSKVVEVIEKTLWVCHGIPGIASPSGDKLIAGIVGIYSWYSVQ